MQPFIHSLILASIGGVEKPNSFRIKRAVCRKNLHGEVGRIEEASTVKNLKLKLNFIYLHVDKRTNN